MNTRSGFTLETSDGFGLDIEIVRGATDVNDALVIDLFVILIRIIDAGYFIVLVHIETEQS